MHLPVQAGSDRILELMNRGYTGAEFVALAKKMKEKIFENDTLKKTYEKRFGIVMDRETLISFIEDNNLENELRDRTVGKWYAIEESIKIHRKAKSLD